MSKSASKEQKFSLLAFIRESWYELKRVHFPSRQEAVQATIVVILMMVVFSIMLGLFDFVLGSLMKSILG